MTTNPTFHEGVGYGILFSMFIEPGVEPILVTALLGCGSLTSAKFTLQCTVQAFKYTSLFSFCSLLEISVPIPFFSFYRDDP